jgi:hypothetical protein
VSARRYGPTYARLLRRQFLACVNALWGLPRLAASCRRAFRPRYATPQDGYNAVALTRIAAADRARLDACARAWGITAHDLLLAIVLKGLSPLTMRRLQSPTQRDRDRVHREYSSRPRGGSQRRACPLSRPFRVSHRTPDDMSLRDLAAAINGKRVRLTAQALPADAARHGIAGFEWRFMSPPQRQRFFAKHFPVCAGTTPLSVDPLWNGGARRAPGLDYLRAVSTGPLSPMILAFTMVGDVINVGITYRTTVFRRDAVEGIAAAMLQAIRTL